MSDNVIKFTADTKIVQPIDEETVRILEDFVERAKAGKIQGVAIVTVESDGAGSVLSTGTAYGGEGVRQNVHAALGAITYLQARFIAERLE